MSSWKHRLTAAPTHEQAHRSAELSDRIRQTIVEHGRLLIDVHALDDEADLYRAGMTSHASVSVMLALEDTFDVEFPDALLKRSSFESICSIAAALTALEVAA